MGLFLWRALPLLSPSLNILHIPSLVCESWGAHFEVNVTATLLGSGGSPCPGSSLAGLCELQGQAPSGCTELRFLLQPHWRLVPLSPGLPVFPALESAVLQMRQACSGLWQALQGCAPGTPGAWVPCREPPVANITQPLLLSSNFVPLAGIAVQHSLLSGKVFWNVAPRANPH